MELTSRIPEITAQLQPQAQAVVERTAYDIQRRARIKIQTGPKTGRVYKRYGREHQASAPGEPPATDTGFLAGTIQVAVRMLEAIVDVFADYGVYLEFGTSRMAPRPFLSPSVSEAREGFEQGMGAIFTGGPTTTLQTRGLDLERPIDPAQVFL